MKIDKLCAIYNVWIDSIELLPHSIESIGHDVDLIVVVYQQQSNYGEHADTFSELVKIKDSFPVPIELVSFLPYKNQPASFNEKTKRNIGLDAARKAGCSHFLHLDSDELYQDFGAAKRAFEISGYYGSVLRLHTYFKKPTLMLAEDEKYYVPFIHKLRAGTEAGGNFKYPFYVDPTRKINESNVVMLSHFMHHFSYVRKNIDMKIRNSSARANIEKGHLREDWEKAEVGMFVRDYNTHLVEVPNYFNIEV